MPLLEDPEDFIAVSVVGSEYAQKWSLEGSPFVYKLHASRYKKINRHLQNCFDDLKGICHFQIVGGFRGTRLD